MAIMGSPKKKSSGPFQSLRNSFLRNKGQPPQLQPWNSQVRTDDTKRKSVQRTTLFRHDYVKVRSWPSDNPKNINVILSKTSFEIYEIDMGNSKERMNYLSLGKKDQFVHPILPKLKVERVPSDPQQEFKIIISLFNPERFWEVTFLSINHGRVPRKVINDLEQVLSKICQYNNRAPDNASLKDTKNDTNAIPPPKIDILEEVDDLEYLLAENVPDQEQIPEAESLELNESSTISSISMEHSLVQSGDVINKTFKQALGRIKPIDFNTRAESSRYKRFSSFHSAFLDVPRISAEYQHSLQDKRRSISVPTAIDYKSISNHDMRKGVDFDKVSWMDVTFEDFPEI
ncbi:Inp1 [Kluyveromyces lactis]|nr:Inp1 [Kluyveromyces lactis]